MTLRTVITDCQHWRSPLGDLCVSQGFGCRQQSWTVDPVGLVDPSGKRELAGMLAEDSEVNGRTANGVWGWKETKDALEG